MAIRNIEDLRLEEITEEYLLEECIDMADALGVDSRQGSIYRDACDGSILRTAKFFNDLRQVTEIISLNTCTGDVLDERLSERGMKRNPETATSASYFVEFVGAEPTEGERVSCDDHFFILGKDEGRWIMTSEETGTEMNNIVSGLPVIPEVDVDDLISATVTGIAVEAVDEEDDDSARQRLLDKISGPAENSNKAQMKSWCEEVEGVGRAKIIPMWNGPMTVKGIIISDSGVVPSEITVKAVQDYVDPGAEGMGEGMANIGCFFTAEAAQETVINVSVTVEKKAESSYPGIETILREALTSYCKNLALTSYNDEVTIRFNSISTLIGNISDIVDYDNLLLNGAMENIYIDVYHVPVVGEVKVNGNL